MVDLRLASSIVCLELDLGSLAASLSAPLFDVAQRIVCSDHARGFLVPALLVIHITQYHSSPSSMPIRCLHD